MKIKTYPISEIFGLAQPSKGRASIKESRAISSALRDVTSGVISATLPMQFYHKQ